ncbi:dihydroorotase [soil metagenome]
MTLVFQGGQVVREGAAKLEVADVVVVDGAITQVRPGAEVPEGARVIGCAGKVVLPGMFDAHVHFRDPGREDTETIRSGSEAAIGGGVTGVLMMPNTSPAIDSGGIVQSVLDNARDNSRLRHVYTAGCITKGRAGEALASIAGMAGRGVRVLTDDGTPVSSPLVLRRAMEYARNFELIVASHCESLELSGDGAINEGRVSYALGLTGIPACSEEIGLDRDIRLAQYTGARLHIQHLSTARGVEAIRRAKDEGVQVSCEVSPHHLIFNEGHILDFDTNFKTSPPLRMPEDNDALVKGLIEGVIDLIATDHAPHSEFEKRQDFASAPFGITGLETALPALYHHFVKAGTFGWPLVLERFAAAPRRLLGLAPMGIREGQAAAEIVVFNPGRKSVFTKAAMRSKSANTPWLDAELEGMVETVVANGQILLER